MRSFSLISLFTATGLFVSAATAIDRRGLKGSREEGDYPYPDIYYKVDGLEGNATTTYYDLHGPGACGCGEDGTAFSFVWGVAQYHTYFAAASMSIFANGQREAGWCGPGCGLCFEANNTAISMPSGNSSGEKDKRIVIVVNDLCPPGNGNERWCREVGQANEFNYNYHFDIRGNENPLGDNVVVNFKQIRCPEPIAEMVQKCQCNANKSVDGDDPQAKYVHYPKY